jgi:hypothetical protein
MQVLQPAPAGASGQFRVCLFEPKKASGQVGRTLESALFGKVGGESFAWFHGLHTACNSRTVFYKVV